MADIIQEYAVEVPDVTHSDTQSDFYRTRKVIQEILNGDAEMWEAWNDKPRANPPTKYKTMRALGELIQVALCELDGLVRREGNTEPGDPRESRRALASVVRGETPVKSDERDFKRIGEKIFSILFMDLPYKSLWVDRKREEEIPALWWLKKLIVALLSDVRLHALWHDYNVYKPPPRVRKSDTGRVGCTVM